ncbi:fasciclin domain-containing protein [Luteimicrobium subarcticum]|uniref:Putative surface protein with fasciclin (FAS1) repeats n=1 Tax=Luteimicrobium subarcticum TaxID=620910 RepID=A0A2M8WW77_9MICO|nr:fasciclin domain-containing protein [Luteimicrobium subarcticum]PJI95170.1 putative surface protein with fasciclin (FAS1) repeats [Luteimicrobium subarcticum]
MNVRTRTSFAVAGLATVAVLGLTACSSDDDSGSSGAQGAATSMPSDMSTPMSTMGGDMTSGSMSGSADAAADLVGPGCAAYAKAVPTGAGSVEGMSTDPVAVAASNNPMLKTLTAAVSGKLNPKVNLVDTLDSSEYTVFAPVDDAFAKIDTKTIDGLKTDDATLTKILTYHVVPGQLSPSDVDGSHKTVEGGAVKVTGSGDDLMVNGAKVICGGVHTQNATVYLIDSVLMPQG